MHTLRPATIADAAALAELAAGSFRDTYSGLDEPGEVEEHIAKRLTPAAVASWFDDPGSTILVLAEGHRLAGYVQLRLVPPPACVTGPDPIELGRIYLHRDSIGQGHGARLMLAAQEEARRLAKRTMWLGVYDRNVRAVEFYRRFGFVEVGTKEFLFGDRIVMDPVMAASI